MKQFIIIFDFDCEGDPPAVFIADHGECSFVEVLEEPEQKTEEWSWEPDDWEPGPIAKALCAYMNSGAYNKQINSDKNHAV